MSYRTLRNVLWGASAVIVAGALAAALWNRLNVGTGLGGSNDKPLEGLRSFGAVPDFSLTERSGKRVPLSDFRGKIWVADFIYTTCQDTCPLESAEMAKLQSYLKEKNEAVRLVSISVDPDQDTPEVLARYADAFHADPTRWLFLTGKKKEIHQLTQEGFHLSAVPVSDDLDNNGRTILHNSHFVVVDGAAEIRGYYDSNDPEALRRLRRDLDVLVRKNKG